MKQRLGKLLALAVISSIFSSCFSPNPSSNDASTTASPTPQATNQKPVDDGAAKRAAEVPPGVLEAKYYQDSDGNAIPDFMETEMGKDPLKDDCATSECGEAGEGFDYFERPHNTLLMLDSSGSMTAGAGGGQTKMQAAKTTLASYVQPLPENFKLGFLVYGHRGNNTEAGKAESCRGVDILAPLGEVTPDSFQNVLAQFEPTGWTPIGAALDRAGEAFAGAEGADNRVIMVSDGLETCGGDPVASARRLHEQGVSVRIDVVGFGVGRADEEQLRAIAEAGGGEYFNARTSNDLRDYFKRQGEAFQKTFDAFSCLLKQQRQFLICDQAMVNKATVFGLLKLSNQAQAAGQDDVADAYRSLSQKITRLREERAKKMEEFSARLPEVQEKLNKITRQRNKELRRLSAPNN